MSEKMTDEELKRVQEVFAMIDTADVVQFDGEPLLNSWDADKVRGDLGNEVILFEWHDADGDMYSRTLTEGNLLYAHVEDGLILCADHEGDAAKLLVYKLTPKKCYVDSSRCGWKYHNGHGGEWETDCGQVYDANDFACQSIRKCLHCNRETFVR